MTRGHKKAVHVSQGLRAIVWHKGVHGLSSHLAAEWRSGRLMHDMVEHIEAAQQRVALSQAVDFRRRQRRGAPVEIWCRAVQAPLPLAQRCAQNSPSQLQDIMIVIRSLLC